MSQWMHPLVILMNVTWLEVMIQDTCCRDRTWYASCCHRWWEWRHFWRWENPISNNVNCCPSMDSQIPTNLCDCTWIPWFMRWRQTMSLLLGKCVFYWGESPVKVTVDWQFFFVIPPEAIKCAKSPVKTLSIGIKDHHCKVSRQHKTYFREHCCSCKACLNRDSAACQRLQYCGQFQR